MRKKEISEKIIGCAYAVYNNMGFGFLESVYEKCMIVELEKSNLKYEVQKPVTLMYEGHNVGDFKLDLLVDNTFVVELKSVQKPAVNHEVQLVNYLKATGFPLGLLINFGEEGVKVKRKFRDQKAIYE